MKLSRFISILLIVSAVFVLIGCADIMALITGEEDNYADSPYVSVLGDLYSVDLHYGESKNFFSFCYC